MPSVGGCDGRCCAVFTYSSTPEELRKLWSKWPSTHRKLRDDLYIADMLIPLTGEEAQARGDEFGIEGFDLVAMAESGTKFYTCRHWDEETRKCGAYEDRPMMCADYPYAKPCDHCECSAPDYTAVKWAGFRVQSYKPKHKLLEAGDA